MKTTIYLKLACTYSDHYIISLSRYVVNDLIRESRESRPSEEVRGATVEVNEPSDRSSLGKKDEKSKDKIKGRPTRVTFADVVKGKVNVRSGAADVNETP
jgi:hypothetical protein